MEVIILAGGKGTRLQSVVNDVPKPMAPINGEPFLTHILNWVTKYPVSKIILSVGYKAQVIRDRYKSDYNGVPLVYAEETTALGTGGGIKYAASFTTSNDIIVINGDTWFPVPLDKLLRHQVERGSILTLTLKAMEKFDRYGTVVLDGDKVISFNEKAFKEHGLINGGIYAINKAKVGFEILPEVFSFEQEVLEKKVTSGAFLGLVFNEDFIDIGVPEDYKKACDRL